MLFNSLVFILFFICFFSAWPFVSQVKWLRCWVIFGASLIFYGWWSVWFVFLLLGTGLFDFLAALAIKRWPKYSRVMLCGSLFTNLGVLAIFKYLDFFIANLNSGFSMFGVSGTIPYAHLVLPVGISFYTFQSMSYTIDVYRGHLKPATNLGEYLAFVSMFPQLVAGPIVRAVDMLPALAAAPKMSPEGRWSGFQWMVHGYFKKMVIADNLAPIVDGAFASNAEHSSGFWWCIVIMFAFQIYCDFSGYSDIARGLGEWMGYRFPVNFNHPYTAVGFRDFWSRWHMSLSTWFRDYVYFPLGGNRRGVLRTHINLWITMLISGFWHGASWTFILWGAVHAALLSLEQGTNWADRLRKVGWFGRVSGAAITFVIVCFTWVLFRSESLSQASTILLAMCSPSLNEGVDLISQFGALPIALVALIMLREAYFLTGAHTLLALDTDKFNYARSLSLATAIVVTIFLRGPGQSFVYFQF